jgi:hypothetical protein
MTIELDNIRARFGRLLVLLFWLHVPLLALVAALVGHSVAGAALAGALLAGAYHLTWRANGAGPATRYLSAVALMGSPRCWSICCPTIRGRWTCTCISSPCWR